MDRGRSGSVIGRRTPAVQSARGILSVNTDPRPTSLPTSRRAPWRSAICAAIVRPSPAPPASRDRTLSARQNRSKTCGRSAAANPGAGVGHRDRHAIGTTAAADRDAAARGRVLQRVVGQDQQQPPELRLVGRDRQGAGLDVEADQDARRRRHRRGLLGRIAQQRRGIHRHERHGVLAGVTAGQLQQVVDQARRPLRLAQDLLHAVDEVVAAALAAQRVLGGGVDQRHRCPQFVRGVGRELPGARERLLDPLEHVVERL